MARRSNLVYALTELLSQPAALEPRLLEQVDMELKRKGYSIQRGRIVRVFKDGRTYSPEGSKFGVKKNGANFTFPDSTT